MNVLQTRVGIASSVTVVLCAFGMTFALTNANAAAPVPPTAPAAKGEVTLAFGGDVHFENQVRKQDSGGLKTLAPLLGGADISMVNLETALSNKGKPLSKEFAFRASPEVLRTLRKRGVDVVTMSNNHAFDYGKIGMRETLRAQTRKTLPIVGIGKNLSQALSPWVKTVNGTSFAFFGAMNQEPLSDERNPGKLTRMWSAGAGKPGTVVLPQHRKQLLSTLRTWSEQVDVVVIYLHWGQEGSSCPSRAQRELAADLKGAGVDLIVGTHAHRLQGAGFSGKTAVAYGLGNLVWYNQYGKNTAVLKVKVNDGKVTEVGTQKIAVGTDGQPRPRINPLQACAKLTSRPTQ